MCASSAHTQLQIALTKYNILKSDKEKIRAELAGGAWCPLRQVANGVKEYLEIDFVGEYRISQTETQGRFGNGLGREFVEQFQLEYWRNSLSRWVPYKDHLGRTYFRVPTQ
ncbi:Epithelial discoidin domain-containing receptor 1 [Orchesella cincta]|uniref:Epithelial discoidin domain-containing receptor 1 n=1 Tax=Orchesella cincta TaxID=48709 RepID=A0A1D2N1X9_ORCCI|nr:Epithelial discoidin domain-containing receptor 1 [Orchesella cincta]